MNTHTFTIADDFFLDGKPFKIISGGIHYFRVVPEYWKDRLEKLKAMGCNTVETYIPWNMHETKKGVYDFSGLLDVVEFIRQAQALDLWVIVRPSPYICAEWEWGGLPAWLLAEDDLKIRSTDPIFMRHVEDYWKVLFPLLTPLQCAAGGPIILMQIENEYGYYGNDTEYMERMRDRMRELGVTVPLVTSDGPNGDALACGSVKGAQPTANYGSRAAEQMPKLERHLRGFEGGPQMVMEFWVGWFDYWGCGEKHRVRPDINARDLDEILRRGSVNFYMFHGGTNFGFMNGSNYYGKLTPDTTSYDYDAPLSEDGSITEKYRALREVIARYAPVPEVELSAAITRRAFGPFPVTARAGLFETLSAISTPVDGKDPLCMEKLGQNYGYTLYQSDIAAGEEIVAFQLDGANDRAQVFVNDKPELTLYDRELLPPHTVSWEVGNGLRLDILTENMGRVNYGYLLKNQRKGIDGGVLVSASAMNQPRYHFGWRHWPLPMDAASLAKIDFNAGWRENSPAFHRVEFRIDAPADTFLDMRGWGKGFVMLNGFNLGRFWEIGPQQTLYVPAPLLRKGDNTLVVFETEGRQPGMVTFVDTHQLG